MTENQEQEWQQRLEHETRAREEAERLLQSKSQQLYDANRQLTRLNYSLEQRVRERTAELREALDQADQFRQLFNMSVDLACILDYDRNLFSFNGSWQKVLGLEEDDLLGEPLENFVDPAQKEQVRRLLEDIMDDGQERQGVEISFPLREGKCWYSFNLAPDAARLRIYGSGRDITEQRRVSRLLRDSESRYRELVMSLKEVIFQTDNNGCWTFLNNAWEEITGFRVEESLGELFLQYVHPADRDMNMKLFEPLIARKKETCRHEVRYITRDGGFKWLEVFARLKVDSEGEVRGTTGTLMDISERKKAEENLLEKNQQLQDFFEHSPAAVAMTDRDMRYIFVSRHWITDYRLPDEDLRGKDHYEVFPEIPPRWKEVHQRVLNTGGCERCNEEKFEREDGRVDWVRWEVRPWRHSNGEIGGLWMFTENITQRKEAELELIEARDRAESANRAKSEFLANMSHEIRTPMNAILGFSELLEKIASHEKQRRYLNSIISSGQTLLQLINDLLDLSKIEAGKMTLEIEPVRIRTVVREIRDMFEAKAREKGLTLEAHVERDVPEALLLDEVRIRQVLLNLVGNALKFTDEGRVSARISRQRFVDEKGSAVELVMEVTDTGIGISSRDQERIFQAFEQQSGQATRKYGGTGLGLAITRRLVELMGGRIDLESTPGQGSTFRVHFPQIDVASSDGPIDDVETVLEQGIFSGETVLIVDDIATNREVICEFLQGLNLNLLQAANGREALEIVESTPPDVLLLDVQMPVMDGWELSRLLKANEKYRHIPVLILSATAAMNYRETLNELKLEGFLAKPIRRQRLIEELKHYLTWQQLEEGVLPPPGAVAAREQAAGDGPPAQDPDARVVDAFSGETAALTEERRTEILGRLKGELMETNRLIQETQEMARIEEFAEALHRISEEFRLDSLARYSRHLTEAVESFDISQMTLLLARYPDLVSELEQTGAESEQNG